jgi:hypothetical protein
MKPLQGVPEHQPDYRREPNQDVMCKKCGKALESLRFGVWLIWISLENGQVCPA